MKKIIFFIIVLFIFINVKALEINSKNAILYNMNENSVIYEKNSSDIVQVASLTKIVTAITVIENVDDLDNEITITYDMLRNLDGYAKVGLKAGQRLSYKDLLYALMLPSAADAAQVLAISTSGSIENFSILMNETINKIGVNNSKFDNPVGMDSVNNYSTAYDMANILIYSLKNNDFKEIFETEEYYISNINKTVKRTLYTASDKYDLDISIILGAKTGFTYDAGLCLASIASINNVDYLLVTLGAPIDYPYHIKDSIDIYNYYSTNYDYISVLNKDDFITNIKIKNGKEKYYKVVSDKTITLYLKNNISKENLKYEYIGINEINKDIKKGTKLGIVNIVNVDEIIYTYDVYLLDDIEYHNYIVYLSVTLIILLFLIFLFTKIKKLI